MLSFFAFTCCFVAVFCASTPPMPTMDMTPTHGHGHHHGHHPTHEPGVNENFLFSYDGISHLVMVLSGHQCYVYTPSDSERAAIHDVHAFRTLETNLINTIDSGAAMSPMTHDVLTNKSKTLGRKCKVGNSIVSLN